MSQNPFNFERGIDELRTISPGADNYACAESEMQRKVAIGLRSFDGKNKMKMVPLTIATAAAVAAGILLMPHTTFAAGIGKVARAFQGAQKFHIKSYWTVDGVRRLNAESWSDSGHIKTRMFDENGKPLPTGDIELSQSTKAGGHRQEVKMTTQLSGSSTTKASDLLKKFDPAMLTKGLDPTDPNFAKKVKERAEKLSGGNVQVEVTSESGAGIPPLEKGSPNYRTSIRTQQRTDAGTVTGATYSSIQYSADSLRVWLKDASMWQAQPAETIDGKPVEHYHSARQNADLYVDGVTALPVRLITHPTVNGKTLEAEDFYDYAPVAAP